MSKKIFHLFILAVTLFMLSNAQAVIEYTRRAVVMCYEYIIPSLFPFFVCSGILVHSGFGEVIAKAFEKIMRPLFNVPESGAVAFVLGIISGFPTGAIYTAELYRASNLSKSEAERLLAFCNNSGPLFIIGTIGISVFASLKYGVILYAIHILSSVLVGILFKNYGKNRHTSPKTYINTQEITKSTAVSRALSQAAQNIITVCFSIIFFSALSCAVLDLIPLPPFFDALLSGLAEFSSGILKVSSLSYSTASKLVLSSVIVGFSGLCVHIQVMSVTANAGLSLAPYIFGKCLHGVISGILSSALFIALPNILTLQKISAGAAFFLSALFLIALPLAFGAILAISNHFAAKSLPE